MRQRRRRAAATATAEPLPRPPLSLESPGSARATCTPSSHSSTDASSRAATAVAGAWATPTPTSVGPRQETAHAAKPPAPVAVPTEYSTPPVPVQNPRRSTLSKISQCPCKGACVCSSLKSKGGLCKPQANRPIGYPILLFVGNPLYFPLSKSLHVPSCAPSPSLLPPVAPRPTRPFLSGISPAHRRAC